MAGGRRTSLSSLAGAKVESVPGHDDPILDRFRLDKVVPTPLNPRTDFGGPDSLAELGESMRKRQLAPVVVVSRASYLKIFPEHADDVRDASHVIANGERRYRGAIQAGLETLEVVIREEVAASREDFLDAVLSENIDRKNFDPIEEALAVQVMVKECGKATAAAERFRRTGGWVSQRLALLRLVPEAQTLVRSGRMPIRDARALAAQPEHEQMRAWRQMTADREAAKTGPVPDVPRRQAPAAPLPPVQEQEAGSSSASSPRVPLSVPAPAAESAPAAGPVAAPAPGAVPAQCSVVAQEKEAPPAVAVAPTATPAGEPEWAADPELAAVVEAGRLLVQQFNRGQQLRLADYLLEVARQERIEGAAVSVPA